MPTTPPSPPPTFFAYFRYPSLCKDPFVTLCTDPEVHNFVHNNRWREVTLCYRQLRALFPHTAWGLGTFKLRCTPEPHQHSRKLTFVRLGAYEGYKDEQNIRVGLDRGLSKRVFVFEERTYAALAIRSDESELRVLRKQNLWMIHGTSGFFTDYFHLEVDRPVTMSVSIVLQPSTTHSHIKGATADA